jgi:hypothetical protein
MPQLSESDAEMLSPAQATALVRVLDLQAQWDTLLERAIDGPQALRARQRASDAYQNALHEYQAAYRGAGVPAASAAVPGRLLVWCRILRTVFRQAAACPPSVLDDVCRVADRTATKLGREQVSRGSNEGQLDAVIAWCQALETAAA